MRILSIHDYPPYVLGGAERQAARLVGEWKNSDIEVLSASHRTPGGLLSVGDHQIPVHHIRARSRIRFLRAIKYAAKLSLWLIKQAKHADIIYCRFLGEAALTAILLKQLGLINTPIVSCPGCFGVSGDARIIKSIPGWRLLIPLINRHCDAINILSDAIASELRDLGIDEKLFVRIPNGINIFPVDRTLPGKNLRFVYAGRCEETKGLDYLITAWRQFVSKSQSNPTLSIVGDGALLSTLKQSVKSQGLDKSIIFHGRVDAHHMRDVLLSHDVLVLPSIEEGISNVVLEAMESAMSVIVTNTGGIDTYISEQCGWVVPIADAKALEKALVSAEKLKPEQLFEMGKNARQLVQETFDIKALAENHLQLFKQLV